MKKCINCGKEIGDDFAFCVYCAAKQSTDEVSVPAQENLIDKKEEVVQENTQPDFYQSNQVTYQEPFVPQNQPEMEQAQFNNPQEPKKKSSKLPLVIILSSVGAILIAVIIFFSIKILNEKPNAYAQAEEYLLNGQYDEAIEAFSALEDYNDSEERTTDALYQKALDLYYAGYIDDAKIIFEQLGDYKDVNEIEESIYIEEEYQNAVSLYEQYEYANAYDILIDLDGYSNSSELIEDITSMSYLGINSSSDKSQWLIDSSSISILGSYCMYEGKYSIEFTADKKVEIYYIDEFISGTYEIVGDYINCQFDSNSLGISSGAIEILEYGNGMYLKTSFIDENELEIYWREYGTGDTFVDSYPPDDYNIEDFILTNQVLYDFFCADAYDEYLSEFYTDSILNIEFYITCVDNDYMPDLLIKYNDNYYMFTYNLETETVAYHEEDISIYIVGDDLSQMVKTSREYLVPETETATSETVSENVYVDESSTQAVAFFDDGTFAIVVNLYEAIGRIEGTYTFDGVEFNCTVTYRDFEGFTGDDVEEFTLILEEDCLVYLGDKIGMIDNNCLFYRIE